MFIEMNNSSAISCRVSDSRQPEGDLTLSFGQLSRPSRGTPAALCRQPMLSVGPIQPGGALAEAASSISLTHSAPSEVTVCTGRMPRPAGGGACLLDRLVAVRQSSRPHQAADDLMAGTASYGLVAALKCTELSLVASRMQSAADRTPERVVDRHRPAALWSMSPWASAITVPTRPSQLRAPEPPNSDSTSSTTRANGIGLADVPFIEVHLGELQVGDRLAYTTGPGDRAPKAAELSLRSNRSPSSRCAIASAAASSSRRTLVFRLLGRLADAGGDAQRIDRMPGERLAQGMRSLEVQPAFGIAAHLVLQRPSLVRVLPAFGQRQVASKQVPARSVRAGPTASCRPARPAPGAPGRRHATNHLARLRRSTRGPSDDHERSR